MTDLFEPDFEKEFDLMMGIFVNPYESLKTKNIVTNYDSSNEKIYDLSTRDGMKEYYLEWCCDGSDSIDQRVEEFISALMKFPNYHMEQYFASCVVAELRDEFVI